MQVAVAADLFRKLALLQAVQAVLAEVELVCGIAELILVRELLEAQT
jgi:hypothetical protein